MPAEATPPSERTTLVRYKDRGDYSLDTIVKILRAGVIAHVGVTTDDGPLVLPMAYGVRDNEILVHGSIANGLLRAGRGLDVCITVTILDGLVVARTPLHNSMNYRSVVIRGTATQLTGDSVAPALKVITDHIAPIWDTARAPSDEDFRRTLVLSVPLTEASAKVRGHGAVDDEPDIAGPHWAGVVPFTAQWGRPIPSTDLGTGVVTPTAVAALEGRDAHPR
jgi:nitroimidazol reductase NimA-like FMN-containing flavoprotein (pyridoxamine 5'-phosphate oxidase superfamily)